MKHCSKQLHLGLGVVDGDILGPNSTMKMDHDATE